MKKEKFMIIILLLLLVAIIAIIYFKTAPTGKIVSEVCGNNVCEAGENAESCPDDCDKDGDSFDSLIDCNDNNPFINPEAIEFCDGKDNDCNGVADDSCSQKLSQFKKEYISKFDLIISEQRPYIDYYSYRTWCDTWAGSLLPYILGFSLMYEATGNVSYLRDAINYSFNIINATEDFDNDGYKECCPKSRGCLPDPSLLRNFSTAIHLTEIKLLMVVVKDARLVMENHADDIELMAKANFILNFTEYDFYEKWENYINPRDNQANFHYSRWIKGRDVLNVIGHTALIGFELYKITGKQKYLDLANFRNDQIVKNLFWNPNVSTAYIWNSVNCEGGYLIPCYNLSSWCRINSTHFYCGPADSVHSGLFLRDMVELKLNGYYDYNMSSFVSTFKDVMWDKNPVRPTFSDFIDGVTVDYYNGACNPGDCGRVLYNWARLGEFDTEIQQLMINHDKSGVLVAPYAFYAALARNFAIYEGLATECNNNNLCEAGETCSNCEQDCGICSPPPTAGGGGGGGCAVRSWNCSEWSLCVDEQQSKECISNCKTKKIENKTCIINETIEKTEFEKERVEELERPMRVFVSKQIIVFLILAILTLATIVVVLIRMHKEKAKEQTTRGAAFIEK